MAHLSPELKEQAVKLFLSGTPLNQIAKEFNAEPRTIYSWKNKYDGTLASLSDARVIKAKETTNES